MRQAGQSNMQTVNVVFREPVQQVLEKVKNEPFFRWLGKKAKNQSFPGRTEERDFLSEHSLFPYEHHDQPSFGDQGLAFQTHALQNILFGPLTC